VEVPLERPRSLKMQTSVEFNKLVEHVRDLLGEF